MSKLWNRGGVGDTPAAGGPAEQLRLAVARGRERASLFWQARTEQERKFLGIGAVLLVVMLVYAVGIDPAASGTARLQKELPLLRQEAAEINALALQAGALQRQAPAQVPAMTRDSLTEALAARGLSAKSISMTGEYAKLQFTGTQFAGLVTWLDAARRESRIAVQDITVTPLDTPGQVDAALTLRQSAPGSQ